MINLKNTEVVGWKHAIRGMRNPMNSWGLSDSNYNFDWIDDSVSPHIHGHDDVVIGPNDHKLAMRLCNAGTDHRKFMRMIICYVDITAPLYWWKEFDTYRSGVEKNSCSTMHKIHSKRFEREDFSTDYLSNTVEGEHFMVMLDNIIACLNVASKKFNDASSKLLVDKNLTESEKKHLTNIKKYFWYSMIQLLPSSYNQRRTCMISYEALANMYHARKNHKLDEWREFCKWVEQLPYSELITGEYHE